MSAPVTRHLAVLLALAAGTAERLHAQAVPAPLDRAALEKMSRCDLDAVFAGGRAEGLPIGAGRGHILWVAGARYPKLRANLQESVWKGKVFHADGRFENQWVGTRAIKSRAALGESWLDGGPCVVLEYPAGTPVFSNARDELREVAPGVWLGRYYDRCPCPKLNSYFVLEFPCGGGRGCR